MQPSAITSPEQSKGGEAEPITAIESISERPHPPTNKTNEVQEKMVALESNLNRILEHLRDGEEAGNLAERSYELAKHARLAKRAFDWLDNYTVVRPA